MEQYNNIHFLYVVDVDGFMEGTPLMKLRKKGTLEEGPYVTVNYSDLTRILLLYLYGGVYFDLDVLSLSEFPESLPRNFAVAQGHTSVNNAVLRFSKKHPFLFLMMEEIVSCEV